MSHLGKQTNLQVGVDSWDLFLQEVEGWLQMVVHVLHCIYELFTTQQSSHTQPGDS